MYTTFRKRLFFLALLFILSVITSSAIAADQSLFGPKEITISRWHFHVSMHTFKADDPGEGVIIVTKSTPDKKIRGGFITFNSKTIWLKGFLRGSDITLEKDVSLLSKNRLLVFLMGERGASITVRVNKKTPQPPPEVTFSAEPQSIKLGEFSTLVWTSTNADSVSIDQGIGSVDPSGSLRISPQQTTTYSLTANGAGGTTTECISVTVYLPPTVTISADPETLIVGESSTLAWSSTYAESCFIEPGIGNVAPTGMITVSPVETTTYTITGTGLGGKTECSVTVTVIPANPIVSMTANPDTIRIGEPSTLSWASLNADKAYIDHGIGDVPGDGSLIVSPAHTTTYAITVTGVLGSASCQTTVTVTSNPEPLPEGSFGKQYEDLIPLDATVEQYDTRRFSLITGLVYSMDDSPIQGVSIAIHDHPEYGTAKTDINGRFSIPVDGGGTMTVVYRKQGLLASQRKVYVSWNDIAIAKTIQMIAADPVLTTINLDGNPETTVTHQSTGVTDEFGSRSCTMVFRGDNRAYLVDEGGNAIHELTTLIARATEYTTPESMPAILPPTSAYTYCVELGVDGVQRVRFDKPVIAWADNFLGFEVGEVVPAGYYDRDRGVWVPSENGVVVKLLDTNTDGIVDALDADGDDEPDDLNGDGSHSDEVRGLDDPQRYPPESTFWRVAVTHFSPWDFNWPFGPPEDAIPPNPEEVPGVDCQRSKEKTCKLPTSSFIEQRSRILHEDLPLPGTDMALHYASNRVEGYKVVITVPASGDSVPESLERIIVKVVVGGRTMQQSLDPMPHQKAEFVWDGLDHLGRPLTSALTAQVGVGFAYEGVYYSASVDFERAFAQPGLRAAMGGSSGGGGGGNVGRIPIKQQIVVWSWNKVRIPARGRGILGEGWTLSVHHQLSPGDPPTLHRGDGYTIENRASIIQTVAGDGTSGSGGDGGPATEAQLACPHGVAGDASGNIYIADYLNNRIRKIDTSGIITTVAGDGTRGSGGDGEPAVEAQLNHPVGVAVDTAGNLFIADYANYCIRKVDPDGIITTVAGDGTYGSGGDGGPATQAQLSYPYGIAVDSLGNLYIADMYNYRIRKVDTSGIITTVAGDGTRGSGGDGGPAIQAQLSCPSGVSIDALGNLHVVEGNRIRKVDTSGIITTVAGDGSYGYRGDGGPAINAKLNNPLHTAVDPVGNLFIADYGNHRIRKIDTSGIITTVAGDGTYDYGGDGGPAIEAHFRDPHDVAVDPIGNLLIADYSDHRIRKVGPPFVFAGIMTAGDIPFAEETGLGHIMSSAGEHKSTIDLDARLMLYEFFYDEDSRLVSISDRFGNETTIERDGSGVPTAVISPWGLTTALTIDADNHLTRITYPDGSSYAFEYTPDGLMTTKTEPEGNRFEHVYDSHGGLTDATDQEGGHWQFSRFVYDNGDILTEVRTAEENLTSYLDHTYSTGAYTSIITDSAGTETLFAQSADGLTVNKSLPCGMELEFRYGVDSEYKFSYVKEMMESTPSMLKRVTLRDKTYWDTDEDDIPDLIIEEVTVNGNTTALENNVLLSQKAITSPEGRTVTMLYDPDTLLTTSLAIPGMYETTYGYDSRGRPTSISTGSRETTFSYNEQGFLGSITDPEDHTTSYTYDAVGQMKGIDRPDGSTVGFAYDANGNMTVLTNPSTIHHGFGYNHVNLNDSYQTPLSGSYRYVYDKDRRLTQIHFPSGKQINNIYNNTRLMQIQTPEGNIDITYLCGTKVGSITKGADSITYGYDGSLITSETLSGTLNQTLFYGYNNDFNPTSLTYAGDTHLYNYDNDGLLTSAGIFTIARNAGNGLPESVTGGSLHLSRTFNGYGEVEGQGFIINSQNLTSWNLTRDDNGRITQKTETIDGTTSNYAYTYDPVGRLRIVTKDSTLVEEYEYGPNGTRIYEMNLLRGISGRTFEYSDEDHLLVAGDTTYTYNVDGFLTEKTQGLDATNYDYSSWGELLSVTLPDGTFIEYVHDPLGRRIAKKANGTMVEKYLWQGLTRLLAVYDGTDNLIMRFEYADGRMPFAMTKASSSYYFAYDQVGSLRLVADASGNVVKILEYDSFGNIINDTNPSFTIPFGFTGGLYDRETGLVRFGFRDYDPNTGRWTAKDPILFAGGDTDLYGYCINDPVNSFDPYGLLKFNIEFMIGLAARFKARVGPAKVSMSIDLGTEHTPIFSDKYVTQSVEARTLVGPVQLGLGAERQAKGETRPPEFDYLGKVIPYSGRSINDILRGKPFKFIPIISKGYWENTKISLKAQFLIGGSIEIDFKEEILFWMNFFSKLIKPTPCN